MSVYHLNGIHQMGAARMLETMINANTTTSTSVSDKAGSPQANAAELPEEAAAPPNRDKIEKAIKAANELLQKGNNISFSYSFDQETRIEVVKVIDNQSGETLRQFPPKDILGMISKMNEMWGILVDKKA